MVWLKRFLKMRRKNNKIKIVTLFILIGIVMLISSVYRIVKLYGMINHTVEYIIADNESDRIKDSDIQEMKSIQNVITISRQTEKQLSLFHHEEEITLDCIGLSDEYLKTAYSACTQTSMKVFYINKKAYDILMNMEQYKKEFTGSPDGIMVECSLGEDNRYSGKVILLEQGLPDDRPYAFYKMDSAGLQKESDGIRVFISEDDMMGELTDDFTKRGYTISNLDVIEQRSNGYQTQLLHIKYSIMIAGLCLVFVCIMCIDIRMDLQYTQINSGGITG